MWTSTFQFLKVTYMITTSSQSAVGIWILQEPEMAFPQLATKFAINFSVQIEIFENILFVHVTNILICLLTFLNKIFLVSKFLANCLKLTSLSFFIYVNMITTKSLYGSKVDSAFHPSKVNQISTRNFLKLSDKK